MWRLLAVLVLAAGCADVDAPVAVPPRSVTPTAPHSADTGADAGDVGDATVIPVGFDSVAATATAPDGSTCELCLWLADTPDQRSRGLMGVNALGPADGMAFRYPAPHATYFWMKNTLLALSIAFYGADGAFLDAFDMEPCVTPSCPRYPTPADFVVAVETTSGGLAALALVPGSRLELSDLPCGRDAADRAG